MSISPGQLVSVPLISVNVGYTRTNRTRLVTKLLAVPCSPDNLLNPVTKNPTFIEMKPGSIKNNSKGVVIRSMVYYAKNRKILSSLLGWDRRRSRLLGRPFWWTVVTISSFFNFLVYLVLFPLHIASRLSPNLVHLNLASRQPCQFKPFFRVSVPPTRPRSGDNVQKLCISSPAPQRPAQVPPHAGE